MKSYLTHEAFKQDNDNEVITLIPDLDETTDVVKEPVVLDSSSTALLSFKELSQERNKMVLQDPPAIKALNAKLSLDRKIDFSVLTQYLTPLCDLEEEKDDIWNIDELLDSIEV